MKESALQTDKDLKAILSSWLEIDDVFSPPFARLIMLWHVTKESDSIRKTNRGGSRAHLEDLIKYPYLRKLGTRALVVVDELNVKSQLSSLSSGPYYQDADSFYKLAQRYQDTQNAFFPSIVQSGSVSRPFFMKLDRRLTYLYPLVSTILLLPWCYRFLVSGLESKTYSISVASKQPLARETLQLRYTQRANRPSSCRASRTWRCPCRKDKKYTIPKWRRSSRVDRLLLPLEPTRSYSSLRLDSLHELLS